MSAFVLKLIACFTMFIDHIGYVFFYGQSSWLNYIGRFAFPIFAFQISEGYIHTKSIKKYVIRLLIFALISQIPFMLFHSIINAEIAINVIFTLLFGLIAIIVYDKCNKFLGILTAILLGIIAKFFNFDYGFYGVSITFLFYVFANNKVLSIISFVFATLIYYGLAIIRNIKFGILAFTYYLPFVIFTTFSLFFILLYNKKKGPDTKHILYFFYPLHLLLIYGLSFII